MAVDFLPVCDLLFNLVSVTAYFCDVAFAAIVAYSLLVDERDLLWFFVVFLATAASLLACQILSLSWFVAEEAAAATAAEKASPAVDASRRGGDAKPSRAPWLVAVGVHFCLCGVLWRYARLLFLPIDMALVKREMRNLSILRLVHAFLQSLACVLAQGYLLATRIEAAGGAANKPLDSRTVYVASSMLGLVNLCWALASFNKHIHRDDIHRLTLTWIGVISQFLWRLGTVGARCLALVLYASVYHGWVFLFAGLHWVCMLTWLVFQSKAATSSATGPAELCCGEDQSGKSSPTRRMAKTSLLLSYGYMVDFVNLEGGGGAESYGPPGGTTRFRMALYYAIVFIENLLLVSLWSSSVQTSLLFPYESKRDAFVAVVLAFLAGLFFMAVYYRVFHVTRNMPFYLEQEQRANGAAKSDKGRQLSSAAGQYGMHGDGTHFQLAANGAAVENKTVFNCALNPAMKKRKKIPRVIPPPPTAAAAAAASSDQQQLQLPDEKPFWKQPLPEPLTEDVRQSAADAASSVRLKLREKRRHEEQQLRSLQGMHSLEEGEGTPSPRMDHQQEFMSLPNGLQHFASAHHNHLAQLPQASASSFGRPYFNQQQPHGHDSSGDQGDIDSADDADWPSAYSSFNAPPPALAMPPSLPARNAFNAVTNYANGARAETQL